MSVVWLWLCDVQMKCGPYHSQPSGAETQHSTILITFMAVHLRLEPLPSCLLTPLPPQARGISTCLHRLWQLLSLCVFIKSNNGCAGCLVGQSLPRTASALGTAWSQIQVLQKLVPYVQ